jgi:penicillin-binding protein 2
MALTQQELSHRIILLQRGIAICVGVILLRLVYLQIIQHHNYLWMSTNNFTRTESVKCLRGDILDCNGRILVTNRPVHNIYWHGTGNWTLTQEQKDLFATLKELTNDALKVPDEQLVTLERRKLSAIIAHDVSFDALCKVLECFPDNKNIQVQTDSMRHYPHTTLACHLVGYLGSLDNDQGKMGLEKLYENVLQGTHGTKVTKINSFGSYLSEEHLIEASRGGDIVTTIDLDLQRMAEEAFDKDARGALVIMDPFTGNIKALLSRPSFDPNMFLERVSQTDWLALIQQHALINRAFHATYPPASIFKLITISAALEENIIHSDSTWYCRGYTKFAGRKYHCNRKYGCGHLTVQEAVALSCNTIFFDIAQKISIDKLSHYAKTFGLGQATQSLFSEKSGIVPNRKWKKETKGEPWWPGETLSACIGQSYLLVTPIQLVRMISAIFTGYLAEPHILESSIPSTTPLDVHAKTLSFLKRSMKSVVTEGTGKRIKSIKDIKVYAKTGTAQTSDLSKRDLGGVFLEHAWLVSHFKYKDNKPLSMIILMEHTGGSKPAITCAKTFLRAYRDQQQHMAEMALLANDQAVTS